MYKIQPLIILHAYHNILSISYDGGENVLFLQMYKHTFMVKLSSLKTISKAEYYVVLDNRIFFTT